MFETPIARVAASIALVGTALAFEPIAAQPARPPPESRDEGSEETTTGADAFGRQFEQRITPEYVENLTCDHNGNRTRMERSYVDGRVELEHYLLDGDGRLVASARGLSDDAFQSFQRVRGTIAATTPASWTACLGLRLDRIRL